MSDNGRDWNAALLSVRGGRFQIGLELCALRAAIENGGAILNHVKFLGYENARVRSPVMRLRISEPNWCPRAAIFFETSGPNCEPWFAIFSNRQS